MSLNTYNQKRNFGETPEPEGKPGRGHKRLSFVVQRHKASQLHYDFRLEAAGVLKSWAVPKGPSLVPTDRRLAVQVEDHPLSYGSFEGDIPEGNYGAGHVDIWDAGHFTPLDERGAAISEATFLQHLDEGAVRFELHGSRLQGAFRLFQMKGRGEKAWLLVKSRDAFALDAYDIESTVGKPPAGKAVVPAGKAPAPQKAAAGSAKAADEGEKFSEYIRPMMARLHTGPFDDAGWIFEIKWDGYRAIAECMGEDLRLYSRNGLSFKNSYPHIFEAVRGLGLNAVLDGEIVAFDKDNNPNFQLLQNAGNREVTLGYYVFDLLSLNGESVEGLPLLERKNMLRQLLPADHPLIRYCDHVTERGLDFFSVMQQRGLEGMIAKKADSSYEEGRRSADWLKVKHIQTDEAVICGYTEPKGTRKHFGALILGAYLGGELSYIGHAGTGFNTKTLAELYARMQPLRTDESPFTERVDANSPVHWLRPELVCNIKYTEVTREGIRRHPVYLGLRVDKGAEEVTGADAAHLKQPRVPVEEFVKASSTKVPVTNTGKVFWPEEGYTKGDLIAYYETVSKVLLPYLKGRPLSLRRNPNGIRDRGFFHKDAGDHVPDFVHTQPIWSESSARDVDYIICNNKATLLYLANLGCIELNPWHSKVGDLEHPDYLVLDLDPSDNNTFDQVIETARAIKQVLDEAGAAACCKTSGSTGIHIYVPLKGKYPYDQVNAFAEIIAMKVQAMLPDFTSLERSIKKRGDAIYIDYMQNNIAQTVAAAYSLRPKPGAPVSAPIHWKELRKGLSIEKFNIRNMAKRIEKEGDLFRDVLGKGINLAACLKRLGA